MSHQKVGETSCRAKTKADAPVGWQAFWISLLGGLWQRESFDVCFLCSPGIPTALWVLARFPVANAGRILLS